MAGLTDRQLNKLENRVARLLPKPWNNPVGRPKKLTLRQALIITCGYARHNLIEQVWADITGVHQSTISRYITQLTPLVEQATAEYRPTTQDAVEATTAAIALVDGTLWQCWSWSDQPRLWAGKYKTTGHGSLIITTLSGQITYVSDPVPGHQHDMTKLKTSDCQTILNAAGSVLGDMGFIGTDYITTPIRKPQGRHLYEREHDHNNQISSLRAPVERAIANLKTWRILFTDYRRPLNTFLTSFRAAIGLYFFKEAFA